MNSLSVCLHKHRTLFGGKAFGRGTNYTYLGYQLLITKTLNQKSNAFCDMMVRPGYVQFQFFMCLDFQEVYVLNCASVLIYIWLNTITFMCFLITNRSLWDDQALNFVCSFIHSFIVCATHVEGRGQLVGLGFFLPICGSWGSNYSGPGSKYLINHLTGTRKLFSKSNITEYKQRMHTVWGLNIYFWET